jgi:hypothetical protein
LCQALARSAFGGYIGTGYGPEAATAEWPAPGHPQVARAFRLRRPPGAAARRNGLRLASRVTGRWRVPPLAACSEPPPGGIACAWPAGSLDLTRSAFGSLLGAAARRNSLRHAAGSLARSPPLAACSEAAARRNGLRLASRVTGRWRVPPLAACSEAAARRNSLRYAAGSLACSPPLAACSESRRQAEYACATPPSPGRWRVAPAATRKPPPGGIGCASPAGSLDAGAFRFWRPVRKPPPGGIACATPPGRWRVLRLWRPARKPPLGGIACAWPGGSLDAGAFRLWQPVRKPPQGGIACATPPSRWRVPPVACSEAAARRNSLRYEAVWRRLVAACSTCSSRSARSNGF